MLSKTRHLALITFAFAACSGEVTAPQDALAAGWTARLEEPEVASAPQRFVVHPDGLEAKPGPNANLWHAGHTAAGNFRLAVDVTHLDSGQHPHGAGLTFGGSDVHGKDQRYAYFLVRSDRNFLIKTRAGDDSPEVVPWTEHASVSPQDGQGVTKNRLTVEALGEGVRFLVNGVEVHRGKRSELPVDGQYGFRLVHDLHVKFGNPTVERLE